MRRDIDCPHHHLLDSKEHPSRAVVPMWNGYDNREIHKVVEEVSSEVVEVDEIVVKAEAICKKAGKYIVKTIWLIVMLFRAKNR